MLFSNGNCSPHHSREHAATHYYTFKFPSHCESFLHSSGPGAIAEKPGFPPKHVFHRSSGIHLYKSWFTIRRNSSPKRCFKFKHSGRAYASHRKLQKQKTFGYLHRRFFQLLPAGPYSLSNIYYYYVSMSLRLLHFIFVSVFVLSLVEAREKFVMLLKSQRKGECSRVATKRVSRIVLLLGVCATSSRKAPQSTRNVDLFYFAISILLLFSFNLRFNASK